MPNSWPYNTARWQRLRKRHLAANPLCKYCAELGITTVAEAVDHIEPVQKAPDRAFDQDNLQSLCWPCHSGPKQSEERTGTARGCDINGIPLGGWD